MIYAGADLHIEACLRRNRPELQQDGFNALYQFRDAILADETCEPKAVLLAGDVFNRNAVNGRALDAFSLFVDTLYEQGVLTYAITGNHDGDYGISILETQGVISLHKKYITIDGRVVTGLNYMNTTDLKKGLSKLSPCDILLLHSPFAHLLGFEGSYQLSLDDLPKVPATIVGDVHVKDFREYATGRYFISPGSLHACAIDQGSVHGFFKLSSNDPISDWKFQAIPTRELLRFKLTKEDSILTIRAALDSIKEHTLKPVIELRFSSVLSTKIDQLEIDYKDKFIFIRKPNISGKIMEGRRTDLDKHSDLKKFTLLDVLPYAIDPEKEPAAYSFLEELLSTKDPEAFLLKQLSEIEGV